MTKEFTTTEAERRAKAKWQEKNADKTRLYTYRSNAKKFIRELASEKDLLELEALIEERREQIKALED